jgi:hypothetical protein
MQTPLPPLSFLPHRYQESKQLILLAIASDLRNQNYGDDFGLIRASAFELD